MAISCKLERSLVSHEEYGVIRASHHPEIYALDLSGLEKLRSRLQQMRDKEQTLANRSNVSGGARPNRAALAFRERPSSH